MFEIARTAGGYATEPTTLVSFNGAGGANPEAGLVMDANGDLFGTAGRVFEIVHAVTGYANMPITVANAGGANNGVIVDARSASR